MPPVLDTHAFLSGELEIRLVDESRRVEGRAPLGASEVTARDAPELVINHGHELIEGAAIAARVRVQELCDFTWAWHVGCRRISREWSLSQDSGPAGIIHDHANAIDIRNAVDPSRRTGEPNRR
jgi:hypothetical protein